MNELNTKVIMIQMPKDKHLGSLMIYKSKTGLELSKAILRNKVLDKSKVLNKVNTKRNITKELYQTRRLFRTLRRAPLYSYHY